MFIRFHYLNFFKICFVNSKFFIPGDISTPELMSIHQGLILIALSTFFIFIPPEIIIFLSFIFIFLRILQSKLDPVPPYIPFL